LLIPHDCPHFILITHHYYYYCHHHHHHHFGSRFHKWVRTCKFDNHSLETHILIFKEYLALSFLNIIHSFIHSTNIYLHAINIQSSMQGFLKYAF
jgi:hypothetical protein